jgi:hypothetical protein
VSVPAIRFRLSEREVTMAKWTRRLTSAAAVGAILVLGGSTVAHGSTAAPPLTREYHIFLNGRARMTVKDAIDGAIRRLARPTCRQLFTEFTDQAGQSLATALAALRQAPADVLADLYFVEADDTNQCRSGKTTAAFTTPGSRVIHICGTQFADRFAVKVRGGEILIIHELLHALGLGENPPSSSEISHAVMLRCGD